MAKGEGSNLTNKYNPQEPSLLFKLLHTVQILPINTILKNHFLYTSSSGFVQILPINTILKNAFVYFLR